jgi:hypothetical protein
LRFPVTQIRHWAQRYVSPGEDELIARVRSCVTEAGYIPVPEFLDLCRWKSPRTAKRCAENPPEFVRVVTRTALATPDERLRIEVLTLLDGVNWPTASVLLHFGMWDRYPILDFRALWSLRVAMPKQYDFDLWWAYTTECRDLAGEASVDMRTLDRALWQYSKEKQRG